MSDKLKTLIDNYIALQDKNVFLPQIDEKNKVEYVEATKKKLFFKFLKEFYHLFPV